LKKIDLQKTEEQLKHHEVERIGSKNPSKFRKSNTDPHRREDDEEENKIILSKHSQGSLLNKIVETHFINWHSPPHPALSPVGGEGGVRGRESRAWKKNYRVCIS
jgi:hypothetical protein